MFFISICKEKMKYKKNRCMLKHYMLWAFQDSCTSRLLSHRYVCNTTISSDYDEDLGLYLADVIVSAKSHRQGFGKAGLQMFCAAAQKAGIPELYDNIAIDNPGIALFLQCEFHEEYRTEEIIMLKRELL